MSENLNKVRNLQRNDTPLPERVVEDDFQLCQALLGTTRQMQSYYGSSPAAKRFEVALCKRELQLPKRIIRAGNGKILLRRRGQQQEKSLRRAALVGLSDGVKIAGTRSYQHRKAQRGFALFTNAARYHFGGCTKIQKGPQSNVPFPMPLAEKGTQPSVIFRVEICWRVSPSAYSSISRSRTRTIGAGD
jgi:hypothetical protein